MNTIEAKNLFGKNYIGKEELKPFLDRIGGKTWQVQWSFDEENRAVIPINRAAPSTN